MAKKACIVFTEARAAEAEVVAKRLQENGFDACMAEVSITEAKAVQAGDASTLPDHVKDCLDGAEVCVILVDEEAALGGIGGLASDGGCRVVTVGGDPAILPTDIDDIIDGHVPSPDAPDLIDVVEGEPERIRPDNSPAPPREPDRVKCQ
ncbi:hypothetical protein [Sphingomonas mesophila]|uniref:hypothetical protein n=1 Tax=Sphingomonas mesophila TaxID=2303576 RepID=UPI0013C2EAE6|nr:hypothetical protein [Sphingomonas mesophila]